MSFETFDPGLHGSPAGAVKALREQGLLVSHRLGARLHALGLRGLCFSLAFLEEALQGGPEWLLAPEWGALEAPIQPRAVRALLAGRPGVVQEAGGRCHLLTPDEATLAPVGLAPASGSLLPAVLGGEAQAWRPGPVWDPVRLEKAALALLDSEDSKELIEALRYLFRALQASDQPLQGLLIHAFRRGSLELGREAAQLVRDHLDRDLGRALMDLLSPEPGRIEESLQRLADPLARAWGPIGEAILLPALTPLLARDPWARLLIARLPDLAPRCAGAPDLLEPFLDELMAELPRHEVRERAAASLALVELGRRHPWVTGWLLGRLEEATDPHRAAFLANALARHPLTPQARAAVIERLIQGFLAHPGDPVLARRLRATFRLLGREALARLTRPETWGGFTEEQRVWLIYLWREAREEGAELPEDALFARFALGELQGWSRSSLLALARTGQLSRPEIVEALRALQDARGGLVSWLLGEARRREPPAEEPILELLATLGFEALERALAGLQGEASLEPGGEGGWLWVFGRLASRIPLSEPETQRLRERVEALLTLPWFGAEAPPGVWRGLGAVGAVGPLGPALREAIVSRLGADLGEGSEVRLRALLELSPEAEDPVRRRIEALILRLVADPEPPRGPLRMALEGLERLLAEGPFLTQVEALVTILARILLERGREEPLDVALRRALEEGSLEDGIRRPGPWDREDRERAFRILGGVAAHPSCPPDLHGRVLARLSSSLEDWLDGVEEGRDLYAFRDTPLWSILDRVLGQRPSPRGAALARRAARRALEVHGRQPAALDLGRREGLQRFLLSRIQRASQEEGGGREEAGDLTSALLQALMEAALSGAGENRLTLHLLGQLPGSGCLPASLEEGLEAFLARQEGGAGRRSGGG